MRRRDLIAGLAVAAIAACSPPAQQKTEHTASAPPAAETSPPPDPALVIRPLYERYTHEHADFPEFRDQAPWSGELWSQLEAMQQRSARDNEPILDFDPFISAQDFQLSDLNVTTDGVVAGSHAVVRASFKNLGDQTAVLYDMIWDGHGWRVDNMRGDGWDLRQIATH